MSYRGNISLQNKIIWGYLTLIAVIMSMVAVLLHERRRVAEIESEAQAIYKMQRDANTVHRYITHLATYGETAIAWEEEDYAAYRSCRLYVDSLLQAMKDGTEEFVKWEQIDTLCHLLANKEQHLYQIMQLFRRQNEVYEPPLKHLLKEALPRTVTRKKKGIPGWFGVKETVLVTPSMTSTLRSLNDHILSIREERQKDIDAYTDSLREHNKELNSKLRTLIATMNKQTWHVMTVKERHLKISYDRSVRIITGLVITAIILLIVSYWIIQRDIRAKEMGRKHLETTIAENTALLEMRKNIILTISHDIRAPLNIISGNTELAMNTREKKRRNMYLNNVGIVCKHVVHLLNNLLDVYRLNEAKETRNDVPFSLNDLLERIATGFSHVVNDKGIRFNCDFQDTEINLHGDVDRIEQIIDNLLTNAVKFTETGTIGFKVRYHEGILSLEIKDTGIGMNEDTLSRIFRPFERLASATNTEGFGLGLPITKGLVNLLDGTINVTSSVGNGSTFRVTLPMSVTDEPVEAENRILPHLARLPQRVLVIDDDTMLRDVVKEMLERNGVTCTTCATVKEIVQAMRSKDYDLILSDIQMPGTNGFELLSLLRNSTIGNSRTIPVVAMTARGDSDKEAFLKTGFTECIYKPFSSSELLSLLSTIKGYESCEEKETSVFDFSTVLSEVNDKVKLLHSFVVQTKMDMEELNTAVKGTDKKRMREIAHRMQPMWKWLQAEEKLISYRELLKDDTANDNEIKEYAKRVMDYATKLIMEAENEIKRIKDETENTDS